jgi:imidazolonepropionase-like amidohydrolase
LRNDQPITLENVMYFNGMDEQRVGPVQISFLGDAILDIRPAGGSRQAGQSFDCAGKTLIPGLIDCHVHVYAHSLDPLKQSRPATYYAHYAATFLKHILSCGFTTVRDVGGGDHGLAFALEDNLLEGPRLFYGGRALSQTGGHGDFRRRDQADVECACRSYSNTIATVADGVDACVRAARDELRKGASHIKIMGSGGVSSSSDALDYCQFSDAEIRALVEECDRHGAYVASHCHTDKAVSRAVRLGVRSVEHATMITPETARLIAETGAFAVPTLSVLETLREGGRASGLNEENIAKLEKVYEKAFSSLDLLCHANANVVFGTDLLGKDHIHQGREFLLRRRVQSPLQILKSATTTAAALLGRSGELGTIAVGAKADMVLVNGNPLERIDLLAGQGENLDLIVSRGKIVKCSL